MTDMEQVAKRNQAAALKIIHAQAWSWRVPEEEQPDLVQDVFAKVFRYPPDLSKAKDPDKFYLSSVYTQARRVLLDRAGRHRGDKESANAKAKREGQENTYGVGLFQLNLEGNTGLMDERILPTMASAEDVFFSKLPNKRQERLRAAIESLPERQREAMYLRTYEELSLAETASRMGITENRVTQLVIAGTKTLKTRLNPTGA